jgi:hypothetical protein
VYRREASDSTVKFVIMEAAIEIVSIPNTGGNEEKVGGEQELLDVWNAMVELPLSHNCKGMGEHI